MKRYIAGSYANSSIMHPEVVDGIQERVKVFLRQCEDAGEQAIDFYVSIIMPFIRMENTDKSRIICTVLQWIARHSTCSIRMGLNLLRAEIST